MSAVTKAPRSGSRVPPPQNGSSYLKGQFIHESFYNLPGSAAEGSSRILNDERGQEHHQDYFLPLALAHSVQRGRRDDSHHIIRAAVSDPKQIKKYPRCPHRPEQSDVAASPWRAVCLDMCACVSTCAKRVCACMHACACVDVCSGGRGAGSTLPLPGHVSQKGRKVFTANSLHSSVSERSAHIRRLHGRKHNLFDATLPTRPEPSSPRWRFTVFNFHFIFRTGRQTGGQVQGNGLHLAVNQRLNTRLNVIWKESTRGPPRITPLMIFVFIYSGMCN